MKSVKYVFLILIGLTAVACGNHDLGSSYTYDLSENGCDTGSHSFSSKSDECNALKDDSVNNNGCAPNLRAQKVQAECS